MASALSFLRRRWWLVALGLVVAAGAALAVESLTDDDRPAALRQLERAQEAGEGTQEQSQRVLENLESIIENLEQGADLPQQSDEIHDLTVKQQESLEDLADVLCAQLEALKRTKAALQGARRSVGGVTRLGERQEDLVQDAVVALRRLTGFARTASGMSLTFARNAVYGARLAEDSEKAFRP
jgi:hypothetical protein